MTDNMKMVEEYLADEIATSRNNIAYAMERLEEDVRRDLKWMERETDGYTGFVPANLAAIAANLAVLQGKLLVAERTLERLHVCEVVRKT